MKKRASKKNRSPRAAQPTRNSDSRKLTVSKRRLAPTDYADVLIDVKQLITDSRHRAVATVNRELVSLYWQIGRVIVRQQETAAWGDAVVEQLAADLRMEFPDMKGLTKENLFRVRKFFLSCREMDEWLNAADSGSQKVATPSPQLPASNTRTQIVATVSPQLADHGDASRRTATLGEVLRSSKLIGTIQAVSWSHHKEIIGAVADPPERYFYIAMSARERWSVRELRRQIESGLYVRYMSVRRDPEKCLPTDAEHGDLLPFKDHYILEFLGLSDEHSECELRKAGVRSARVAAGRCPGVQANVAVGHRADRRGEHVSFDRGGLGRGGAATVEGAEAADDQGYSRGRKVVGAHRQGSLGVGEREHSRGASYRFLQQPQGCRGGSEGSGKTDWRCGEKGFVCRAARDGVIRRRPARAGTAAAAEWLRSRGFLAGSKEKPTHAAFVFATSAGEVGVDSDADHMACDLVAWERMVQRLGRVNRRGDGDARIVVVAMPDPPPGRAVKDALAKTPFTRSDKEVKAVAAHEAEVELARAKRRPLELLPTIGEGGYDASPGAIRQLKLSIEEPKEASDVRDAEERSRRRAILLAATTSPPLGPALTRALVDAWSMTSLREHTGRPLVAPWLRGWVDDDPQTAVVWRKHLPLRPSDNQKDRTVVKLANVAAFFEAAPPHASELLETEIYHVRDWLERRASSLLKLAAKAAKSEPQGESPLRRQDVVAVLVDAAGDVSQTVQLGDLIFDNADKKENTRNKEELERQLIGATLVVDARLAGLGRTGLLDADCDDIPRTIDDGETWLPPIDGEEVVRFKVRLIEGESAASRDWHSRFRMAMAESEDGEPTKWLVVEKWRHDAATEDDRSEGRLQSLAVHQQRAEERAKSLAARLGLTTKHPQYAEMLAIAARLHDEGKRSQRWQRAFKAPNGEHYAKTPGPVNVALLDGYRHEFGSLPVAASDAELLKLPAELQELALHMIAAHHGFARPVIGIGGCDDAPPSALEGRARDVALRFARLQKRWAVGTGVVGEPVASGRSGRLARQRRGGFANDGGAVMAEASIPVDLFNPGQVFACMGFVEAANVLLGDAEGGFDWNEAEQTRFRLRASGDLNPAKAVLRYLAECSVSSVAPSGIDLSTENWRVPTQRIAPDGAFPIPLPTSPATLPAKLNNGTADSSHEITIDYWGDARNKTSRDNAKFWAGAGGYPGAALTRDALQLVRDRCAAATDAPFDLAVEQSSSFRFDWRRDYIPLDIGFSLNNHAGNRFSTIGYPLVEVLAAIGLTNSRPALVSKLEYRYGVLGATGSQRFFDPLFLRAALGGSKLPFPQRRFNMLLGWPGKEGQARCITTVTEEFSQ